LFEAKRQLNDTKTTSEAELKLVHLKLDQGRLHFMKLHFQPWLRGNRVIRWGENSPIYIMSHILGNFIIHSSGHPDGESIRINMKSFIDSIRKIIRL
jgi:hypothetical protein